MPPPLDALAALVRLDDGALATDERSSRQDTLYGVLRREHAIAASAQPARSEVSRILDFAQAALGDVVGVLIGREDRLLDSARDGEWSLRDGVRHAIA